MVWVRLDDRTMSHAKLLRAGPEGVALWLAGLCHANGHATDGDISRDEAVICSLYPPLGDRAVTLASRLVTLGLWEDAGDHYHIHDYEQYQEEALSENIDKKREQARERKRRQRDNERDGHAESRDVTSLARARSRPGPARPVTEREDPGGGGSPRSATKSRPRRSERPTPPVAPPPPEPDELAGPSVLGELAAVWARHAGHTRAREAFEPMLGQLLDRAERDGLEPAAVFERAVEAFVADCRQREKRPVLSWLNAQLGEWFVEPTTAPSNGHRTMSSLTPEQEADRDAALSGEGDFVGPPKEFLAAMGKIGNEGAHG